MAFLPGLELSRRYHDEVVGPLLAARVPGLRYAAGRLDAGSELLGFDTPRSTDHDWGARLQIFLDRPEPDASARIEAALADGLPDTFLGVPARFAAGPTTALGVADPGGDRHGVTVHELGPWLVERLGFDPRDGVRPLDWLATPTQRLAELTGGAVFADGLGGALRAARAALAWYPDDVWRLVLAAGWARIAQEEHLMGRAGEAGDDLGSAVLAARLARDLMRLCLLLDRRYPPYGKWLGSALRRVPGSGPVVDALAAALAARGWPGREEGLCRAYELVGARCNAVGLAEPVDPSVRPFFDRPFRVLDAGRFAATLRAAVTDERLRVLPPVGAVDQWVDGTDALGATGRLRSAVAAFLDPNER
jgi:hypothetical protein